MKNTIILPIQSVISVAEILVDQLKKDNLLVLSNVFDDDYHKQDKRPFSGVVLSTKANKVNDIIEIDFLLIMNTNVRSAGITTYYFETPFKEKKHNYPKKINQSLSELNSFTKNEIFIKYRLLKIVGDWAELFNYTYHDEPLFNLPNSHIRNALLSDNYSSLYFLNFMGKSYTFKSDKVKQSPNIFDLNPSQSLLEQIPLINAVQ